MKAQSIPKMPQFDLNEILSDFKSLDYSNPGTWPLVPRIVIIAAIFLAILAAGWWFDWRDQIETLETKQQQEVKLKAEYLEKKKQTVNLEEYRKQLVEIDRAFGALLKQLPNKAEMESLLIDINQAGLGRGLQFELFKPSAESIKDFYAEMPISVKVTGGYHDFGAFAGDIAKLARIVTLREIAIDASNPALLKMDVIATTYRYLDEEDLAKQKSAKSAKSTGK